MPAKMIKRIDAHAKINLFLEITGRRPDGYHTIDSVMHKIPLSDTVTVCCEPDKPRSITLTCDAPGLGTGEENIAYRAAAKFSEKFALKSGREVGAVSVDIQKRIPMAAGMAGGSADAAAVLVALGSMFDGVLSEEELLALGASLGADIPFCMSDGPMRCTGIGEIMTPCAALPECKVVVAMGKSVKVSTAAAYAAIDAVGDRAVRENGMCDALASGSLERVCGALYNVFETVNPETDTIRQIMLENGAGGALLSGSGPAVFGLFASDETAANAVRALTVAGCRVYI